MRGSGARRSRAKGGEAIALTCNISRKEELQKLVDDTSKHWGGIDVLVCNAAVNPYYGPSIDMPDDAYDKVMNSNVRSNFWLCNMVLPQMAERGGGSIDHHFFHRRPARLADARRVWLVEGGGHGAGA